MENVASFQMYDLLLEFPGMFTQSGLKQDMESGLMFPSSVSARAYRQLEGISDVPVNIARAACMMTAKAVLLSPGIWVLSNILQLIEQRGLK